MKFLRVAVGMLLAAGLWSAPASAVSIAPVGTTDVTVADDVLDFLGGAGISASPIPPATASGATFSFPITGGETDPLLITHAGGLRLEGGGAFLEASDFVIDGVGGTVSGTASGTILASPVFVPLFDLANVAVGDHITADLLITEALNSALGGTFADGADLGLTGATFGSAVTSPQPIPLPAGGALLASALMALAAFWRRRAAA